MESCLLHLLLLQGIEPIEFRPCAFSLGAGKLTARVGVEVCRKRLSASDKSEAAEEVMLPTSVTNLRTSSELLQLTGVIVLQLPTAQENNSIPKA